MRYNKYTNLFEQPTGPGPDAGGHAGRIMLNYYTDNGCQIDFNNMVVTTPGGSSKIPTVNQDGKPVVITQTPVFPGGGWTVYSRPAKKDGKVIFGMNFIHIVDPEGNNTTVKVVHGLTPKWEDIRPRDYTFVLDIIIAVSSGGGGEPGSTTPVIDDIPINPSTPTGVISGPFAGGGGGPDAG